MNNAATIPATLSAGNIITISSVAAATFTNGTYCLFPTHRYIKC